MTKKLMVVAMLLLPCSAMAQDSLIVITNPNPLLTLEVGPGFFSSLEDTMQVEKVTTYVGAGLNLSSQVSAGLRLDLQQEGERKIAKTLWAWLRGHPTKNEQGARLYMQLGLGTNFTHLQAGVRGGYEFPLSDYLKAFIEVEGRWVNETEIETALTVPVGIRAFFGHRS